MTMAAAAPARSVSLRERLQAWRQWPRETRDTLFQLAVIGWIVLPHLGRLPAWCTLMTLAVLAWRAHLALRNGKLPGQRGRRCHEGAMKCNYLAVSVPEETAMSEQVTCQFIAASARYFGLPMTGQSAS